MEEFVVQMSVGKRDGEVVLQVLECIFFCFRTDFGF